MSNCCGDKRVPSPVGFCIPGSRNDVHGASVRTPHTDIYALCAFSPIYCKSNNANSDLNRGVVAGEGFALTETPSYLEPVDGAAVDEGGELAQSVAEGITDGAEGDHDVQVLTATVDEESKQGQGAEVCVLVTGLSDWPHSLQNS